MITAKAIATVAAMLLVGSVLHRALAVRLLALDGKQSANQAIPERDLFLLGLLPGIALIGAIDTYLATVHLFRADVTAAVGAGVLILFRRDTIAVFNVLIGFAAELWSAPRRGDLLSVLAACGLVGLIASLCFLAQIPAENVDVWVFQLPLSISMADHSGFIYPQMDHPFYGNNPLFFNLLFAQGLLFVDHYIVANAVNILIYVGFIVTLVTYARRGRALALLFLFPLIDSSGFFTSSVAVPLIDMPRTCFSVMAVVFADRYRQDGRCYDIAISGLLVGAAVAGKYTELVTLGLIGLCVLPRLLREGRRWAHLIGFAGAVFAVASFWYLKNWILLGNPIYPFLFAHPGLSDAWVADYMLEMKRAFDPADRIYETNLLTLKGWHDFAFVMYDKFFDGRVGAKIAGLLVIVGVALPFVRVRMLAFCTIILFIVWYAIMFNSVRWAMPAYLLLFVSAFVVWVRIYDRLEMHWVPLRDAAVRRLPMPLSGRLPRWLQSLSLYGLINLIAAAVILYNAAPVVRSVAKEGLIALQPYAPAWIDRTLFNVAIGRESLDDHLSQRRQGYALYRYIAVHDLRMVFQPFDNGAVTYATAYNGGRDGNWILPYRDLPKNREDVARFIKDNNVRYYIYRKDLSPVEVERLGQSHIDLARAVIDQLSPQATAIMTDSFGWSLYEVAVPAADK